MANVTRTMLNSTKIKGKFEANYLLTAQSRLTFGNLLIYIYWRIRTTSSVFSWYENFSIREEKVSKIKELS